MFEGSIGTGKAKFGKRRAERLDKLRLPEVTVDVCNTSSYVSNWRRLDPQLPRLVRNYDDKNTCIKPNHEYATNFEMVKYKLRYSQYIDALAHVANIVWYTCTCT